MYRGDVAREVRRQKAEHLKHQRNTRSIKEQLALLDSRPGNSEKERARLLKLLEKSTS